ncbi:hypothetical protein SAMN04488510_10223 [Fervidobacterium changbaicum]|uniref:Uncharacterized protein n=1 Tax=Fervidobacterium islandicum TaxID=2423 RepID=A0AAI8GD94_FERIS|nr:MULTISPECIES: hypothetical protein [Fervidobacterium]AMW32772.1 hypothetical protein NA23_05460 [Fervidobacterium islandicum]SDG94734.1 hypothetical protein SAMN04488510_10223 [Fervidobacterium changbaicum]
MSRTILLFVKILGFFVALSIIFSATAFANILVLFNNYGWLIKNVDDGFVVPQDWQVLQVSASRWYVESKKTDTKYELPSTLPLGTYTITENYLVSETGEVFANTPFGLAKVLEKGKVQNVLKLSEKADVLFRIPGFYRIYYSLKGDMLEQFFELRAPVENAYVILSTAPEESRVAFSKMAVAQSVEAVETSAAGRKIFILGNMEGLDKGINIRNKVIKVVRRDVNRITLNYSYSYDWQPADYVVELKTGEELPSGELYVYGNILGYTVPIGYTQMPDLNKEGNIFVSKSWQVFHSWTLTKLTKAGGRIYITGDLNLKGNGIAKIVIQARGIANLTISSGTIVKQASDYAEIELNVSGVAKVAISFNYLIE